VSKGPEGNSGEEEKFSWHEFKEALLDWHNWAFSVLTMCIANPIYGLFYFLPSIFQDLGFDGLQSNLLTVPVYVLGTGSTLLIGWNSDRTRERPKHMLFTSLCTALGFLLVAFVKNRWLAYFACFLPALSLFPTVILSLAWLTNSVEGGTHVATSTAMVNSLGNSMVLFVPLIYGWVFEQHHSYFLAHLIMAAHAILGIFLILALRFSIRRRETARRGSRKHAQQLKDEEDDREEDLEHHELDKWSKGLDEPEPEGTM
jgi:cyanate permease